MRTYRKNLSSSVDMPSLTGKRVRGDCCRCTRCDLRVRLRHPDLWAEVAEGAAFALWLAGEAHLPAVQDEPVAEPRPVGLRDELVQHHLHLHRVVLAGESQPPAEPADVRIDGDARHPEAVA